MFPYIRSLRWRYVNGALFLLATNAFALLIPWYMKLAVEGLQHPSTDRFTPGTCALIIAFLAIAHCVTRVYSRTMVLNAARIIEFRIREDMLEQLLKQDLPFLSGNRTGDIMSRFSNDLTNVRMLVGFGVMSSMNVLILYVSAVSFMLNIHPLLTVCAIVPFPLMVLVVKKVSHRMFKRSLEAQEELGRLTSLAEESVSAVRLIRSYCREEHFQDLFGAVADRYLTQNLKMARLRGLIIPVMALATGSGTLIVLFMGGRLVISGGITLGDFVAFSGYLAMLVWPTVMLGWILTMSQRGASSMSRLNMVLAAVPNITDTPDANSLQELKQGIEFRGLSFSYGDVKVLGDISLTIKPGERIGITGEVGSGKTTLLRMLPRLLPTGDGQLFIDGQDVNHLKLTSLRSLIGYVPQEAFLFSRSIRENIAYGVEGVGVGEVEIAARQAGFTDDVAKFAEGFETLVGEKGVALSGGQKQRLSIARALLAQPQILLLDDPLSAVDAGREEEILGELGNFFGNRTVLIVSHRLSVFRDCNRVVVLKEGRIVEQGAPADLLASNGVYAEMFRMQQIRDSGLVIRDQGLVNA